MAVHRISLAFRRKSNTDLRAFTDTIILGFTDNPAFPSPPVSMAELTALNNTFANAIEAGMEGGRPATRNKSLARQAVLTALRTLAHHVETKIGDDLTVPLSTHFQLASKNRAQRQLDVPVILSIKYGPTTTLLVTLRGVPNARGYMFETSVDLETWVYSSFSTKTRKAVIKNLTPGVLYWIRVQAVGGKTGASNWCLPVQCRAV